MEIYSTPYILTNVAAVLLVICAAIWPTACRILFSVIFIAAAIFNAINAFGDPGSYLTFGEITPSGFYRWIILGPFSQNVAGYVLAIALGQLAIGIFMNSSGILLRLAMIGAIIFFVAISPLGYGSAFPAPLIMAFAIAILFMKKINTSVPEIMSKRRTVG